MRMTLTYARNSDRAVADEYSRVTEAVEAAHRDPEPLSADLEGPNMVASPPITDACSATGTAPDSSRLDCTFESICERCGFYETGPPFVTIHTRQRDHAADNDQTDRAQIFTESLDGINDTT